MPESWLRVAVRSPSDELDGLLTEGLLACGGSAVEENAGTLVTYVPADGRPVDVLVQRIRDQLRDQLAGVLGAEAPDLVVEQVPEQDWLALWRAGLEPRRVGDRIIVSPTWSEIEPAEGELLIRIDPQMAFGTGEHASTRGVLRLMQTAVVPGSRLLDVGSGSAILSIAAALLGAARVVAVESDEDAMPNAAENVEANGVADRVELVCALVDDRYLDDSADVPFDGILANVLSGVLTPLLPAFHRSLVPGGWAILSGILIEEAAGMRTAAAEAGFVIDAEDAEDQWWSVRLKRV